MRKIKDRVESTINIGGKLLSVGQAMTLRVAIGSFISSLQDEGLGDDEHGKRMTKAYLQRLSEIEDMISTSIEENQKNLERTLVR